MPKSLSTKMMRRLIEMVVVAALYFFTGKLGFQWAIPPGNVTVVWPPSGIAWAAVLLRGPHVWFAIWVGSFFTNLFFFQQSPSISLPEGLVAAGIAVGSTLQALLGAWLIRRFVGLPDPFHRTHGVAQFSWIGPVGCLVAATIGVLSLCLGGFVAWFDFSYTWLTWWLGDLIGVLILVPLVLTWSSPNRVPLTPQRFLEGLALLVLVVFMGQLLFGKWSPFAIERYPLPFILIPLLIWSAVRFGPSGVMLSSLLMSSIALMGTVQGLGPFARDILHESLLLLQAFMGVITMTGLFLAASVTEWRQAAEALRLAHDQLERRIEERTAELRQANQALQEAQLRLIQAEKLESIGRLSAGIAHEVKNPLATIFMGVEYLAKHLPSKTETTTQVLKDMEEGIHRADGIIKGLLDFSVPAKLEESLTDLNAALEQAFLLIRHELTKKQVTLIQELDPHLPLLLLDRPKMEQVFLNLFMNALDAMPSGGRLGVRTSVRQNYFKVGETVVVAEIEDTGTGIPEIHLSKLFDPFFTTKPTGKGTGLGLAVTKAIMDLHGGMVDVRNRPEGGVRVTLLFKVI